MLEVSNDWKNIIYDDRPALLLRAQLKLVNGTVYELDFDADDCTFMYGDISFEDGTSREGSFDIGCAVMNTFNFALNNYTGRFNDVKLDGAEIIPEIGLCNIDDNVEWIQKGVYIITDNGVRENVIDVKSFDRMKLLEKPFAEVTLTYPTTLQTMAEAICNYCGVTLASTDISNGEYVIYAAPIGTTYSCRQMIGYIAQIAGCYARFNALGNLEIKWYNHEVQYEVPIYKSLEVEASDIEISGIQVKSFYNENAISESEDDAESGQYVENEETIFCGTEGYVLSLAENPLIPYGNAQTVAEYLWSKLEGTVFRPLKLTTLYDPAVEAGDVLSVTDNNGDSHKFYVTNMSMNLGAYVQISCDGKNSSNSVEQYVGASSAIVKVLDVVNAKIQNLVTQHLEAEVANVGFLKAEKADLAYAKITKLDALEGEITILKAKAVTTDLLDAEYLKAVDAEVKYATIENLSTNYISANNLSSEVAKLGYLQADKASVAQMLFDVGLIDTAIIENGHVTGYLDAVSINANSINAGTLSVDRLIINGTNESLIFALNNSGELESRNVDTIDGNLITKETILADHIAAGAITANKIASDAVTAQNILGGCITGDKLDMEDIFAREITATNLKITGDSTFEGTLNGAMGVFSGKILAAEVYIGSHDGENVSDIILSTENSELLVEKMISGEDECMYYGTKLYKDPDIVTISSNMHSRIIEEDGTVNNKVLLNYCKIVLSLDDIIIETMEREAVSLFKMSDDINDLKYHLGYVSTPTTSDLQTVWVPTGNTINTYELFTAPENGLYFIHAICNYRTNATGWRHAELSTQIGGFIVPASTGFYTNICLTDAVYLTAGTVVSVRTRQTSGSELYCEIRSRYSYIPINN